MDIVQRLGLAVPILQAPMAGVSTPAMAAAISNAGGLGALGLGAAGVDGARAMIRETRALTERAFNANVFCHAPARRDAAREAAWCRALAPEFARFDASPPGALHEIYTSFTEDRAMLEMLLEEAPGVVSLHFGLPDPDWIRALQASGSLVLATATSLDEARAARRAGVDAVVAQGIEAGGHRGMFDPDAPDQALSTDALVRTLVSNLGGTIIAAGGLMSGQDVARAIALGAQAAQLGTAFIDCRESAADAGYRAALRHAKSQPPVLTRAISGRPARCLQNRFTIWGEGRTDVPDYPVTYDAGKALHAAARAQGEQGFGAHWAGLGAPLARHGDAAEILDQIAAEWRRSRVI